MDEIQVRGRALLGALVSGVLAAGTLTVGPAANATCASFFGIGNSADCTSGFGSIAVALGPNATATAEGILDVAVAIGTDTEAWSVGNVSLALAAGPNERAFSFGTLATALAVGVGVGSTYAFVIAGDSASDFLNIAIGIGKDGAAWAGVNLFASQTDRGNLALFLGQGGMAASAGILNSAINVGGNGAFIDNLARAVGVLSTAVNLGGNNNSVAAGPGPLAMAVSAFTSGATVTKSGPGININGFKVPNTAATADVGPVSSAPDTFRAVDVSSLPARRGSMPASPEPAAASVSQRDDLVEAGQRAAGGHEKAPTGKRGSSRGRLPDGRVRRAESPS